MEVLKEIFSAVTQFFTAMKINPMYVLLWVAAGYIQKEYFTWFVKFGEAWKTLILGSFFSVIYAFLLRDFGAKGTWVEFAASYVFATSMYELFIKALVNKIIAYANKWFDNKLNTP